MEVLSHKEKRTVAKYPETARLRCEIRGYLTQRNGLVVEMHQRNLSTRQIADMLGLGMEVVESILKIHMGANHGV